MTVIGLAAVEAGGMDAKVTGVEGAHQLLQRMFLCRALRTFEQDDRTPPMRNLRQLPFRDAIAKRAKRLPAIIAASASETGFSIDHGVGSYRNLRRAQPGLKSPPNRRLRP
jgi:hypothetical protein